MTDLLKLATRGCRRVTRQDQIQSGMAALKDAGLLDAAKEWADRTICCDGSRLTVEDVALSIGSAMPIRMADDARQGRALSRAYDEPRDRDGAPDLVQHWASMAADLRRIADKVDPPPPDKVGTPYVAERLGCTTVWVTEMIRSGDIPRSCIVPGTGNGKPWKFHRGRIDEWLESR